MKFLIVLKDGVHLYGDYVDVTDSYIKLTEIHKVNKDDDLEDSTFTVHIIYPQNISYSSCENLTWDEYCDYIASCEDIANKIDKVKQPDTCNCETCTECDCDQCDDASNVSYDCASEPGNMFN